MDLARFYSKRVRAAQDPVLEERLPFVPLHKRQVLSIANEPRRTIRAITGFPDAQCFWNEYLACGGHALFDQLDGRMRQYSVEELREAAQRLVDAVKYPADEVWAALGDLLEKHKRGGRVRPFRLRIPRENLFGAVWAVVAGGLRLDVIAALPYFHLSEPQLSLLVHNALPLVANAWQERWCPPVPLTLQWLRANCTDKGGLVRLVVLADGTDVDTERSGNRRTARFMYGTKKKTLKHHAVRQIVWSNMDGQIVRVSPLAAGSYSEVELLEHDGFLDNINLLAKESGSPMEVCLILDRGYYTLRDHINADKGRYASLRIVVEMPTHLTSPGRRPKGAPKIPKRTHFLNLEVCNNRLVASRRACNEIANLRLKWSRLFQRRIPLSLMPSMGHYQTLAVGLARMRAHAEPNKK